MIIINEKTMSIKHFEQVIRLEDTIVEVKMHDKVVKIKGTELMVSYFTSVEVMVHGNFLSVVFI